MILDPYHQRIAERSRVQTALVVAGDDIAGTSSGSPHQGIRGIVDPNAPLVVAKIGRAVDIGADIIALDGIAISADGDALKRADGDDVAGIYAGATDGVSTRPDVYTRSIGNRCGSRNIGAYEVADDGVAGSGGGIQANTVIIIAGNNIAIANIESTDSVITGSAYDKYTSGCIALIQRSRPVGSKIVARNGIVG